MKEILGQYFKHDSYSSFLRQLSNYGFKKRIDIQPTILDEYIHEKFKRDDSLAYLDIVRRNDKLRTRTQRIKNTANRAGANCACAEELEELHENYAILEGIVVNLVSEVEMLKVKRL